MKSSNIIQQEGKKCNPRKDDLLDITFLYGGSKVKTVWIELAVRLIEKIP